MNKFTRPKVSNENSNYFVFTFIIVHKIVFIWFILSNNLLTFYISPHFTYMSTNVMAHWTIVFNILCYFTFFVTRHDDIDLFHGWFTVMDLHGVSFDYAWLYLTLYWYCWSKVIMILQGIIRSHKDCSTALMDECMRFAWSINQWWYNCINSYLEYIFIATLHLNMHHELKCISWKNTSLHLHFNLKDQKMVCLHFKHIIYLHNGIRNLH